MTGRTKIGIAAAAIVLAAGITALAQGLGPSSSGSLSELTGEVRQLRVAIQEASRSQNQMQALNISLTAQHSRLTQVSARMDAAQEELRKASDAVQNLTRTVADAQEEFANFPTTASAAQRAQYVETIKDFKATLDRAVQTENDARAHLNDLANAFRTEEGRWRELAAKLEEILKK